MRLRWIGFAALVAFFALPGAAEESAGLRDGRRIVLITLDTLRFDAVFGSVGTASGAAMPLTRARLEKGTVFERFYAASSSTQPTHASIFTGLHPWQHGVHANGMRFDTPQPSIVEILRNAGFSTAAVVASFPVGRVVRFDRGFDQFVEPFSEKFGAGDWGGFGPGRDDPFYASGENVTSAAFDLLNTAQADRQFYWFHYFDPHSPYGDDAEEKLSPHAIRDAIQGEPDLEEVVAQARRLYAEDVASLDHQLDLVFARLAADSERFETHVVVTADHGEAFGEGGSFGHGKRLLESTVRVPTAIVSPRLEPGIRTDVAGSVDLASTILDLAGIPTLINGSRNLRLYSPGARAVGMRRTFEEPFIEQRADGTEHSISGPWFYWADEDGRFVRGNSQALSEELPHADEQKIRGAFSAFEKQLAKTRSGGPVSDEEMEKLEALGYVR